MLANVIELILPRVESWLPPVPVLQRPLSWDSYGLFGLDADAPLSPVARRLVQDIREAELGRAQSIARYSLERGEDDLIAAWALSQIVRVYKQPLQEYRNRVRRDIGQPATAAMLLYRFYICRLAEVAVRDDRSGPSRALDSELQRVLVALRDDLRRIGSGRLGVVIALTQSSVGWSDFNRTILAEYRATHGSRPDVRPLLCRAYLNGVTYFVKDKTLDTSRLPNQPDPKVGLALAQSILAEKPKDALGLFYKGRAQFMLNQPSQAILSIRSALDTHELPSAFEKTALLFLRNPNERAFHAIKVID